jgi:polyferredoxin
MVIVMYVLASAVFWLVFRDLSTIVFFVILAVILVSCMSLSALVPLRARNAVRMTSLFLISSLLFGLACVAGRQNFQIEGFFFYVLTGTFGGVIVHYLVGKVVGPLVAGRTWCGWGCWTMMVLDLLPYKKSRGWEEGGIRNLKYVHIALSVVIVSVLVFAFGYGLHDPNQLPDQPGTMRALSWFLVGNGLYYVSGIALAVSLKDNRAFCKYLCPVSVLLKGANALSLLRIKGDAARCSRCGTCVEHCPFTIDIPRYVEEGTRVASTECVMCMQCVGVCPEGALRSSIGLDLVRKDHVKRC